MPQFSAHSSSLFRMGGCLSGWMPEESPKNDLIIDVQQIIADDAWEEFVVSSRRGCRPVRLKRSDYVIDVPMNYYHFEVVTQEFKSRLNLPSLRNNAGAQRTTTQAQLDRASPDQLGLKTEFRNDTDKDQTYNFRMEKTRRATVHVNYQRGFSIGGKSSFTLGLPKVLEGGDLSAEINATYEVTNSRGQEFEETLTTEANSQIVVTGGTHCTAQMILQERRLLADFKVSVMMYMPEKAAVVEITNREGRVVFLKKITDLPMLFPESSTTKHIPDNQNQPRQDAILFEIHGYVDGMQLSNHYIHLKGTKLPAVGMGPSQTHPMKDSGTSRRTKSDDDQFTDLEELGYKPGF